MEINQLYPELNRESLKLLLEFCYGKTGAMNKIRTAEKDLYLTGMLRKIFEECPDSSYVYFKGGTALSKCHKISERFSEDCDLFVFSGDYSSSKSRENKLNNRVTKFTMELFPDSIVYNEDGTIDGKRGGDYNQFKFSYENSLPLFSVKKNIEFEVSSCALMDKTGYHVDSKVMSVQPLLGEDLERKGHGDLVEKYGLKPFLVRCLTPEKTLCDKISRCVRISYSEDNVDLTAKYIRDLYDVTMFMRIPTYYDYIRSEKFLKDMFMVNREDLLRNNSHAEEKYSDAVLFKHPEQILSFETVIRAYNSMVSSLVFNKENAPKQEEILQTLSSLRGVMQSFDQYRESMREVSESSEKGAGIGTSPRGGQESPSTGEESKNPGVETDLSEDDGISL